LVRFTYSTAGVDRDEQARFLTDITGHMRRTFGPQVIENFGGFAGLFALYQNGRMFTGSFRRPVLVACADGVGTKLKIAFALDKHDTVGRDLVAMNVNDLLTLGASPLFFLDYMAVGEVGSRTKEQVLKGIADGCEDAGCALLGGETAQMPDFYGKGEYDLAGFAVGIVEKRRMIDGRAVRPGNVVIGLASNGLHSNGFSLVRKVLLQHRRMRLGAHVEEFGQSLGEELLRPTFIYARALRTLRAAYRWKHVPAAIAHITGGGLPENVPRVVPPDCEVRIRRGSWPCPPIFDLIQKAGEIDDDEMFRVFNMGIGMVLIVPPFYADAVMRRLKRTGEAAYVIGEVRRGKGQVKITS